MNANEIKNDLMCRPDFSQTGVSFTIADTIVPCWEWECGNGRLRVGVRHVQYWGT